MMQLVGVWRSYKTFLNRGEVKKHSTSSFWEITLTEEGEMLVKLFSSTGRPKLQYKGIWEIRSEKRGQYLYIGDVQLYEVITWEQNELVLQVSGEKLFFAPLHTWADRLHPERVAITESHPIMLWSANLIERIKS